MGIDDKTVRVDHRPESKPESVNSVDLSPDAQRRRLHIQQTPLAVIDWDLNFCVVAWNPAAERIFGYSEAEALGRHAADLVVPPEYREHVDEIWDSLLAQTGGSRSTNGNITRDGRAILCEWYNTHLVDGQNKTVGVASLTQSQARYESAQRIANIANFDCDLETRVLEGADRLLRILELPLDSEAVPTLDLFVDRVIPEDRETLLGAIEDCQRRGITLECEFRVPRAEGKVRWIRIEAGVGPIDEKGARGGPHLIGIIQDISERKAAQDERRTLEMQVQHAQKHESLGVLAGGIAHDFNNLLVAILGNAELAFDDLPPGSSAASSLEEIKTAARRAAELTNQMLAYSGRGSFVVEEIDLNRLVQEMRQILGVSVSKKVVLREDYSDRVPVVRADASQLRQVVMNLITNASDAIGEDTGMVTLRTGIVHENAETLVDYLLEVDPGWFASIEVSDTGCGMDTDTQARLFDPFFTTKIAGRGLGLAAVIGIVRRHAGTIRLYSEPGLGTTFRILLPTDAGLSVALDRDRSRGEDGAWRGRGRVLVADDEDSVRSITRRMLERLGLEVLMASDGRQAVEIFSNAGHQIDLVLLDLTMPEMTGKEVFIALRRLDPNVRIVLMSGYTELDVTERFVGRNFFEFLHKPFDRASFTSIIRAVFETPTHETGFADWGAVGLECNAVCAQAHPL